MQGKSYLNEERLNMNNPTPSSWHGLDKHILATLMHRSWTVLAGGVTVMLIPLCFDSVKQGYYFAFYSILALQIFFELGMGQVVIQIVAHEAAHLRQNDNGSFEGDNEHMSRLFILRAQLQRWYFPAAVLFAAIVSSTGLVFFGDRGLSWEEWEPAWMLLVGVTAINLNLSWRIAMVEGFGLVKNISQLRLWQSLVGYLLFWCCLVLGAGLWVVVIVPAATAVSTAIWLRLSTAAAVFAIESDHIAVQPISWSRDILPFQWRIAVSWISGYFIFQLFTPLIFEQAGAAEAGRLGLAITVFAAIGTIGLSWVNAKASKFSMMIARRESIALLNEFKGVALRSLMATTLISISVILIAWYATVIELQIMSRISDLSVLICLAFITIINSIIFSAAIFMRAHREEPMLANSVVSGLIIAIVSWFSSKYGAFQMMAAYAAVTFFIGFPWTIYTFHKYILRHR